MTDGMGQEGLGFSGKVAIVTGGGAADDGIGNGRAAAILLARAGAKVLVVDLDRTRAERTVTMIAEEGGTAASFVADVTDEQEARAMVDAAVAQFGRLDCLDNNVGIGGRGTVVEVTPADWRRVMHVNVESMFMASRHAIPAMMETAGGGAIVNVSSISALRPRGLTAYSTSKGAVIALTRAMAVDHGPGATPRCSASRASGGTSATPSGFCCRPKRATLPARLWWSMAEPLLWDRLGHPIEKKSGRRFDDGAPALSR